MLSVLQFILGTLVVFEAVPTGRGAGSLPSTRVLSPLMPLRAMKLPSWAVQESGVSLMPDTAGVEVAIATGREQEDWVNFGSKNFNIHTCMHAHTHTYQKG